MLRTLELLKVVCGGEGEGLAIRVMVVTVGDVATVGDAAVAGARSLAEALSALGGRPAPMPPAGLLSGARACLGSGGG